MARTFDIRFDAAANSFGWSGGGRLSVDTQGLSFTLKRGIASLLARHRSQRIPADRIIEVYREGDALRVEFAMDDNPRAVLPFSARNREAAVQIVQLLPTSRTIEIEDSGDETRARKVARRTPLMLAAAMVLVFASGALFIAYQRPVVVAPPVAVSSAVQATTPASTMPPHTEISATSETAPLLVEPSPVETESPTVGAESVPTAKVASAPKYVPLSDRFTTPDEARKLAMLAEDPIDWTSAPPSSDRAVVEAAARDARMARLGLTGDAEVDGFVPMELPEINVPLTVVPIKQTTLDYATARDLLNAFEAEAGTLTESYRREREAFDKQVLDVRTFADRLDALEPRWRKVSDTTLQNRQFNYLSLTSLRATLLTVVIQQRVFLTGYAAGLRAGDQERIDRAFKDLARADDMLALARKYVN